MRSRRGRLILFMALALATGGTVAARAEEAFLPIWMTPEESLHVNEIGRGHVVTVPPGGWVETPAEYEPLRGVWITWIYSQTTYRPIFRSIVQEVVETCKACIIASASDTTNIKSYLTSGGVPLDSVRFYLYPYNSVWIRDYGPWFIRKPDHTEGIVDFRYNRPRPSDDTISWRIGASLGIPIYGSPLSHPGGNFMVDGRGLGFFSSLIYEENSGYTARQIDSLMLAYNGLERTAPQTRIRTEYTGHIDLWTKILNDTLVMVGEYAPGHENDTILDNRAAAIAQLKNREGFNYRVARVVMPWTTSNAPPTYLNGLFVNNKLLVPTWGRADDSTGVRTFRQALPGHRVVAIDCSAMSGSGGAIHCITMQMPSSRYVHLRHYPLPDTTVQQNPYRVRARIITSASLLPESTLVYYKIRGGGTMQSVPLSAVVDTPGVYAGYIPPQSANDTIYYFLLARNIQGIRRTSPSYVPPQLFSFRIRPSVAVEETKGTRLLTGFSVCPNPVTREATFGFSLAEGSAVRIEIFNPLGQRVKTLLDGPTREGPHLVSWDRRDDAGRLIAPGVYFFRLDTGRETRTGKLVLIQ